MYFVKASSVSFDNLCLEVNCSLADDYDLYCYNMAQGLVHINHCTDSIWQNAIIMLHSNQFIGGIFHIYCWCLVKILGSTIFIPHTSLVNLMMLICYYCVVHKFHADRLVSVINDQTRKLRNFC
jgi:hypothetical protein